MPKLNNTRRIKAEDFDSEYAELINQLGAILNSHMQEVEDIFDGRVDFENRPENLLQFSITVGSDGVPIQTPFRVSTGLSTVTGFQVISARNQTNSRGYPTSTPFVSFTPIGGGAIRIDHISGLLPNEKYQLVLIAY